MPINLTVNGQARSLEIDPDTTIEGLAAGGALSAVQQAWLDQQVPPSRVCRR